MTNDLTPEEWLRRASALDLAGLSAAAQTCRDKADELLYPEGWWDDYGLTKSEAMYQTKGKRK